MRILFIYAVPPDTARDYTGYHHGIGILSAVLKKEGHDTRLLILSGTDTRTVDATVRGFKPDLAAFSVTSRQYPLARRTGEYLDTVHGLPSVFGGPHATVMPEQVLTGAGTVAVCRGEGEYALPAFVSALETGGTLDGIPNLVTRSGTAENFMFPPVDLASLPDADRRVFGFQTMLDRYGTIMGAEFLGSRGCPYHCIYCANHVYNRRYQGSHYRRRSVEDLIREIRAVAHEYRFPLVGFHDDVFTFDRGWLEEFTEKYPRDVGLPFWCNTRADCVDETKMKLLKKAGCRRVHIGVETGSEALRRDILRRNLSDDQITAAFRLAQKHGIKTLAFNMIGLPFETEADIRRTIALNRRLRPDRVQVTVFNAYPGTEAYALCKREGLLPDHSAGETWFDPAGTLVQPQLSSGTVEKYLMCFVREVYE